MLTTKDWAKIEAEYALDFKIPPGQPQVPDALAAVLYEKSDPVRAYLAHYTRLIFGAGKVLEIDDSKLDEYETMLEVACHAENALMLTLSAVALKAAIQDVRDRHKYEAPFLARRLYEWLAMADFKVRGTDILYERTPEEAAEFDELYEKFKNDANLTDEKLRHYKGEIDEWQRKSHLAN
ncbi:hypothetical protein SC499_20215 [Peribacillus simplex]|uniref:hypothetical protein n=1 Tax=Peribacillus simplex TaxID=1478 RepID=UPI00298E165E|nr:hypothetical protein [Peribacillus simplex]MDW7616975.1 hypothetical protein [Peribacillus simplex]